MTEEEKLAAEAKALADAEAARIAEEAKILDPLAEKDALISKLTEERDNYKLVALKRKGKLAEDDEFFKKEGIDDFIEDRVKTILADREVNRIQAEKEAEIKKMARENSELRLALKNRPGTSIGGESGGAVEVKDNVLSADQIRDLTARALRLKADPAKFIERFKKNLQG